MRLGGVWRTHIHLRVHRTLWAGIEIKSTYIQTGYKVSRRWHTGWTTNISLQWRPTRLAAGYSKAGNAPIYAKNMKVAASSRQDHAHTRSIQFQLLSRLFVSFVFCGDLRSSVRSGTQVESQHDAHSQSVEYTPSYDRSIGALH